MSKNNPFSGQVFTSRDAALTALIDTKGGDYMESSKDVFYWKRKGNEFSDGPYTLLQTKSGKWTIW